MDRLRRFFRFEDEQSYERLAASETLAPRDEAEDHDGPDKSSESHGFSSVEYIIFLLLGISMLWAWNMFLAAGPYFQYLFRASPWLTDNFQAAEISVSTVTNFGSVLVLTRMQSKANYPRRVIFSLAMNIVTFALLAASTVVVVSAELYFGFLIIMIFVTSLAAGYCQNGIFAYVSGFAQSRYTQGIMVGQAVAGVLPCIAQIVSILSVKPPNNKAPESPMVPAVRSTSALAYFSTATAISVATLFAFLYLLARNNHSWRNTVGPREANDEVPIADGEHAQRKSVSLWYLYKKLRWFATGVFISFAITMLYPVYTQQILSNRPPQEQGRLFQPPVFIPLAFLFWNTGDLLGRLISAVPSLSLVGRPRVVFSIGICRIAYVGLYNLCNVRGRGAAVPSDFFYLVVVQLIFGISNGYMGSTCMIAAAEWVEPEEREAAGGFMGLCLIGGLTAGSLTSFLIANI